MPSKKGSSRLQAMMAQFSYDHRCADSCLNKIRKNADELDKFLDTLSPGGKNKNFLDFYVEVSYNDSCVEKSANAK